MAGLNAGELDREIVIQTATASLDPVTNQPLDTWDAGETVWAKWLPGTAREVWQARQIDATIEGAYVVYDLDPLPTPEASRIVGHDGRTYDVKGVSEIGRDEGLMITVSAKAVSL